MNCKREYLSDHIPIPTLYLVYNILYQGCYGCRLFNRSNADVDF